MLVDLGSGIRCQVQVLLPYHGVKRRGSDAQCIPAAGCSTDTRISDPTTPISNSLLRDFFFLLFFFFLQAKVLRNFFYYYLFALSAAEFFHPNRCVPKTHHICLYAKWTKRRIFFWDIQVQKKKKSSLIKSYFFLIIN